MSHYISVKRYSPKMMRMVFQQHGTALLPVIRATGSSLQYLYFMPLSIGMIIAIVIVGALLALLMLRKRP